MATTHIVYTNPAFKVADDEAGLTTGEAFECQLTSAVLTPNVTYATFPATGCSGPSESPSRAAWTLTLNWLQDFTAPGGGLSGYSITNATQEKWFELIPDKNDTTVTASGPVFVTPGAFGGTFGDGSAGTATADWKCSADPTFLFPAALP